MRILLVAEESAGINVLRALAGTEHDVVAALTAEPTHGGGATVASVAEALGVPVLPSISVRDPALASWVRDQEIDLLLNVHSLYVVSADVVAAPRIGSFNVHPGPLPEYAGLNAPSWAIYHGEPRHAVTIHWMDAGIDTGPIAYSTTFDLTGEETGLTVSVRCAREGVELVLRLVDDATVDPSSIPRKPQDPKRRRYFGPSPPDEARIGWRAPAREVVALVRACDYAPFPSPWGNARARWQGRELAVLKASRTGERAPCPPGTVGRVADGFAIVATGDEWIRIGRVRYGDVSTDAGALLAPGDRLEDGA